MIRKNNLFAFTLTLFLGIFFINSYPIDSYAATQQGHRHSLLLANATATPDIKTVSVTTTKFDLDVISTNNAKALTELVILRHGIDDALFNKADDKTERTNAISEKDIIRWWELKNMSPSKHLLQSAYSTDGTLYAAVGANVAVNDVDKMMADMASKMPQGDNVDPNIAMATMMAAQLKGSNPFNLTVLNTLTEQPISVLNITNADIRDITFSKDNKYLAFASADGVEVWNAQTGQQVWSKKARIRSVMFSGDSNFVLVGFRPGKISRFDLNTSQETPVYEGKSTATLLDVSPDGNTLAIAEPKMLHLWDIQDKKVVRTIRQDPEFYSAAFSMDGTVLATVDQKFTFTIWDAKTGKSLKTVQGKPNQTITYFRPTISFSPDGKRLAVDTPNELTFWGIVNSKENLERVGIEIVAQRSAQAWVKVIPERWKAPVGVPAKYRIAIEPSSNELQRCTYNLIPSGAATLIRLQHVQTVTITDLQTGAVLGKKQFYGSIPKSCPQSNSFSSSTGVMGGTLPQPDAQYETWLKSTLAKAGLK
jgi:WD40 repeat protein